MTTADTRGQTTAETCAARTTVPGGDEPLRGALLSEDLLEDCAKRLALEQKYATVGGPRVTPLLPAVEKAETSLLEFRTKMTAALRAKKTLPAASEWLHHRTVASWNFRQHQTRRVPLREPELVIGAEPFGPMPLDDFESPAFLEEGRKIGNE